MRKRIFTKQIGVTLTEDTLKKIIESTTQHEVSTSAWVRDAIETKLALDESSQNDQPKGEIIMTKKSQIPCPLKTKSILWEGASVIKLVRELQDFLKTKMKQVDDPTFGTYWICTTCDRSKEYKCWGKTAEFCAKKGLDLQTFTEVLNSFSGFAYDITSDADVLNRLQVKP